MKLFYVTYISSLSLTSDTQFFRGEELAQIASHIDIDLYGESNRVDYIEILGDNIEVPELLTPSEVLEELAMVCEDSSIFNKYADKLKELM